MERISNSGVNLKICREECKSRLSSITTLSALKHCRHSASFRSQKNYSTKRSGTLVISVRYFQPPQHRAIILVARNYQGANKAKIMVW